MVPPVGGTRDCAKIAAVPSGKCSPDAIWSVKVQELEGKKATAGAREGTAARRQPRSAQVSRHLVGTPGASRGWRPTGEAVPEGRAWSCTSPPGAACGNFLPRQTDRPRRQRVRGPVPPAAEMLVLLLLLVWGGVECAGRGLQAGAEADSEAGSPPDTVGQQSQNHRLPGQVTVQQGLCVSIPCNFSHPQDGGGDPGSVLGYWFQGGTDSGDPVATNDPARRVKEGTQGRFQLLGDPRNGSCSLLIRDANKSDGATYFFQAKRGDKTLTFVDHKLSLTVTDLTQKPDIYVPETLEPGHLATLLCVFPGHSEGCPPPRISWSGAALSPQEAGPRNSSFSVLTLTPKPQDHNSTLTCHVNVSQGVSASSTVRLSVAHAPKDLVINVSVTDTPALEPQRNGSSLGVKKGHFLQLLCEADGHPPPTLSWVLDDRVLSWSPPIGPRTLVLERPQVGAKDTGRYTCRAENRLGSLQSWLDLSVQYPPENLRVMVSPANRTGVEEDRDPHPGAQGWECWWGKWSLCPQLCVYPASPSGPPITEILGNGTTLPVLEGQSLRLVCVADSSPPANLSWDGGSYPLNSSQPSDSGILELPRVQKEDEGEVTCRAQSPLGSQHVTLHLSVLYPPELLSPSCSWEAESGLHCSCSTRALPAPSLRWRVGDLLVKGNSSEVAIMVTSISEGPWANSSLSLHEGLIPEFGVHCEARNAHGARRVTVLLVKTHRKKTTRSGAGRSYSPSVSGATSQGHQPGAQTDRPPDDPPPAEATSGGDQELHYASVLFQGRKTQDSQEQEATSDTEYSEIKIQK
ncbi:LOW QUALITY PROTEIN: sialic acid-binding Ig-like lectin 11 [Rhynchocyon petersi]